MCSILAILDVPGDPEAYRARALRLSRLQRHRGPDWSGVDVCPGGVLVHERLAIVDPASGAQPLYGPGNRTVLCSYGYFRRASMMTGDAPPSSCCFRSSFEMRGTATKVLWSARARSVNQDAESWK